MESGGLTPLPCQEEHWKLDSIEICTVPSVEALLSEREKEESMATDEPDSEVSLTVSSNLLEQCSSVANIANKYSLYLQVY